MAVVCFGRAWPWLRDDMRADMQAEALLRLTEQADALAAAGPIDPKCNTAYACAIARHACVDYVTKLQTVEKWQVSVKFAEFLRLSTDSTVFNGYETEYRDRGSCIPMSEYMGEEEIAALEAFITREPQKAWRRSELKRRALNAIRSVGVEVDGITTYTIRVKRSGDVSHESE